MARRCATRSAPSKWPSPRRAFTFDRSLSAFTFRCEVPAEPDDGEQEATERAIAALAAHGYPHRILRIGVTDTRNIKIRRKSRGAGGT
ncbi:DUF6204 family protein [Streptomyces sp. NPDC059455]|uniref:DUF6204 family protein n=1 Tax=Streptomyces sp. NPDC059455 TaxID=3346837 RepID=UPI00368C7523